MSLVDPQDRWWRRPDVLRVIVVVGWVVATVLVAVTAWANTRYLAGGIWETWGGESRLVAVAGVPERVVRFAEISLGVVWIPVFGMLAVDVVHRVALGRGHGWPVAHLFGTTLVGMGVGSASAIPSGVDAAPFAITAGVLGIAVLAVRPAWTRISVHSDRREWSATHGTPTVAVVTAFGLATVNDVDRWTATLKFTDVAGRNRWHKAWIPKVADYRTGRTNPVPKVGDRFELRYDPAKPGRRSSVHVDLAAPIGEASPSPRRRPRR